MLSDTDILAWLGQEDTAQLEYLWRLANQVRRQRVGDEVHLRGLIEISNHCVRSCAYCGLRAPNDSLTRYRMAADEIVDCARQAVDLDCGTVVLQAGEDPGLTRHFMVDVVERIKTQTPLAVTLSLGERDDDDLSAWRAAGADRYLLRFETSDRDLYDRIHPPMPGRTCNRLAALSRLRKLGYEIGSGVMIGIPGQTYESLARDIQTFARLDLDMIGVGPFIPHPRTPLGNCEARTGRETAAGHALPPAEQVPNTEQMTYKVMALARLLCPQANIPATTALATLNKAQGRELGLARGANVLMPNITPIQYRPMYEIYPAKACIDETSRDCHDCLLGRIRAIGRIPGTGAGGRRREKTRDSERPGHGLRPLDPQSAI